MEDKEQTLKIQKTEWIYRQIQRQRQAEDALFERICKEQEVLDRLKADIEGNMEQTKEARKYNREFQERMDAQVYAMYGITEDKLQGIQEYKNAYYRGCAFSLFLLSVLLVALCGFLHGFQSQVCLSMLAFAGMEGTLLAKPQGRGKVMDMVCKVLYLLIFPLMMVVFICFELGYREYHMILPWLSIFGICLLIVGTASQFFYNPYRKERKNIGAAKDTIREIEKAARKEVRKDQKSRAKTEKKQQKLLGREAARQRKLLEKEEKRQQRLSEISGKRRELLEKKEVFLGRFQKKGKAMEAEIEAVEGESLEAEAIGQRESLEAEAIGQREALGAEAIGQREALEAEAIVQRESLEAEIPGVRLMEKKGEEKTSGKNAL